MVDKQKLPSWAEKLETPKTGEKVKWFSIKAGESKEFVFAYDKYNGREWHDEKYDRDYIIFQVNDHGVIRPWAINPKAYTLLEAIRSFGFPLEGKRAIVSRKGSGKKDTLYAITLIPEQ